MRIRLRHWRFWLAPMLLLLWYVVLIARATQLHLEGGNRPKRRELQRPLTAARGTVYDRSGHSLAYTSPGRRVFIDYASVRKDHDLIEIVSRIADYTGRDTDAVLMDFKSRRSRYMVQGIAFDGDVVELETNKLHYSGVGLERVMVRQYAFSNSMAHVLGFINSEQVGSAGIEQYYNSFLKSTDGFISGTRDGFGREIRSRRSITVPPVDGANVHLTLDLYVQLEAEKVLEEQIAASNASGGRIIIQMVKTGEILAMAQLPTYTPSDYQNYRSELWRNSNISEIYDPGSTMKSVIVAAAMNEGIITANTIFDVGNGKWFYGGYILNDKVYGRVDTRTIIKKSSNIGAAQIGLRLGNKRMERYLRAFGFGSRLGVDLPGEENGILGRSENWDQVKPTRIAIGQGISVTPLQMLNAYCTIGNGGRRMRPYVVSKVVAPNGETIVENQPTIDGRPIRRRVAEEMLRMMTEVTREGGTARRAALDSYNVAGKTGTAQMVLPGGGYSNSEYWASFIGLVPAEDPVFGVIVIIDRPKGLRTGGVVAGPAFAKIAETTAQYLELPAVVAEGVAGMDW